MGGSTNEDGAIAAEYAISGSLIAVVIILSVTSFGTTVAQLFVVPWP
jgi:Flp pilus assembly pilin Flp